MSQETTSNETKINDLKEAMKEILITPINILQSYRNFKNLSPKLKEIFTRYNIGEMKIETYIRNLFRGLKFELEKQGQNFNLNSNLSPIDLINVNVSPFIIKLFIFYVFGIIDSNEISNICQQIISELRQQIFNDLYLHFSLMQLELRKQLVNYIRNCLFIQLFMNALTATNSFIFISCFLYRIFISENLNLFANINRPRLVILESGYIAVPIEDMHRIFRSREEEKKKQIKLLINILTNMVDKFSGIFSRQKIENVINFLKDILENNNKKEIYSVYDIICKFDNINNRMSVLHFLYNFSDQYPIIMNENFDFKKIANFIDNELSTGGISRWRFLCKEAPRYIVLKEAFRNGLTLSQFKYLIEKILDGMEKITNESEQIAEQRGRLPLLPTPEEIEALRNKVFILPKVFLMEESQNDLDCKKILKLRDDMFGSHALTHGARICDHYLDGVIRRNNPEEINLVLQILNSQSIISNELLILAKKGLDIEKIEILYYDLLLYKYEFCLSVHERIIITNYLREIIEKIDYEEIDPVLSVLESHVFNFSFEKDLFYCLLILARAYDRTIAGQTKPVPKLASFCVCDRRITIQTEPVPKQENSHEYQEEK